MDESYLDLGFPTRLIGRRVFYHAQLGSTSTRVLEFAHDPANEGLVVLADEQVAGRGTRGRHWFCPAGSGLLLSVLLFPPPALRRPVLFAALAGVAVCETVFTHLRRQASLKWPNDVLVCRQKVCGILVEHHPAATVLGIGLNVDISEAEFRDRCLPHAGSLSWFASAPLQRMDLLRTLVTSLDDYYAELQAGQTAYLEARWRWHSSLLGRQVVVQTGEEVLLGRLLELSFDRVDVQISPQGMRSFRPEELDRISLLQ